MSFEGKNKKSEQADSQENKSEKELSLSEIDELLKESEKVSDNLDKFSKDEIYKKVGFYDKFEFKDKLNDEDDSIAYEKAGFWKKYENFTRFGFHKERYGLLKSKERGLLDKSKINKDVSGQDIDDSKFSELEKFAIEEKLVGNIGMRRKDLDRIMVGKRYEIVDGEIVKIIKSHRTESGAVEAAGEMREAEISRLETVNGAELVRLKEAMERSAKSKESFLNLGESMSNEEREKVNAKLNEEESQTKGKIKEREEKLAEETKIFSEPLEGRLQETLEIENSLMEAFDFIKTGESNLNKQIKECELFIKEAQKLDLLGGVGSDVVKIFEDKKALLDTQAKEFAERKELVYSKLVVLNNNKEDIEAILNRVNNIGKTEKEIEQEKKETEEEKDKETKTETKPTENKKSGTESADTKKDKDDEREEKTWDETRDEVWGLSNAKGKTESRKDGKTFNELFPDHNYSVNRKENSETEDKEKINQSETEEEIEVEENEEVAEKVFTHKEIEEIAMKELKNLGIMSINDRTMREQITSNVTMAVEAMIAKSKKLLEEEEIKKEVGDWYRKYSKNYFKKGKQPKI